MTHTAAISPPWSPAHSTGRPRNATLRPASSAAVPSVDIYGTKNAARLGGADADGARRNVFSARSRKKWNRMTTLTPQNAKGKMLKPALNWLSTASIDRSKPWRFPQRHRPSLQNCRSSPVISGAARSSAAVVPSVASSMAEQRRQTRRREEEESQHRQGDSSSATREEDVGPVVGRGDGRMQQQRRADTASHAVIPSSPRNRRDTATCASWGVGSLKPLIIQSATFFTVFLVYQTLHEIHRTYCSRNLLSAVLFGSSDMCVYMGQCMHVIENSCTWILRSAALWMMHTVFRVVCCQKEGTRERVDGAYTESGGQRASVEERSSKRIKHNQDVEDEAPTDCRRPVSLLPSSFANIANKVLLSLSVRARAQPAAVSTATAFGEVPLT